MEQKEAVRRIELLETLPARYLSIRVLPMFHRGCAYSVAGVQIRLREDSRKHSTERKSDEALWELRRAETILLVILPRRR